MYKPWAYTRTQGFLVGLYTEGAYTQGGLIHKDKKMVSIGEVSVNSMGNLHSKSLIFGVYLHILHEKPLQNSRKLLKLAIVITEMPNHLV